MLKHLRIFFFASIFFYLPLQSMAWGQLGHRIVGQIAETYLSAKAAKEIKKILGNESLAMASNWGDFIKSNPAFKYLSTWHYVNLKTGMSKTEVEAYLARDTVTDAYTKTNFLIKELKKKDLSEENKLLYLRLLIHIVGDIHQPLHVGRPDDEGGNKIRVQWFNQPFNLHQIWDDKMISGQDLSYTEYANWINFTTKEQRRLWQSEPISQWFWESYQVAELVYNEIKQPEEKLSYKYSYDHIAQANNGLLKGGVHLAGLLNEIFQ